MNTLSLGTIAITAALMISACTPGPMGTKRYKPYTGSDAAVVYTQLNTTSSGLFYLERFSKEDDCYKSAERYYISNNFMTGDTTNHLIENRIQANQNWALYTTNNSSSHIFSSFTAFIPESGKRYVAIASEGVVEIPDDLKLSDSDNLAKVYEQYKGKQAKIWNVRNGRCKFWFAKLSDSLKF